MGKKYNKPDYNLEKIEELIIKADPKKEIYAKTIEFLEECKKREDTAKKEEKKESE